MELSVYTDFSDYIDEIVSDMAACKKFPQAAIYISYYLFSYHINLSINIPCSHNLFLHSPYNGKDSVITVV